MKRFNSISIMLVALAVGAALFSSPADARRGHARIGVFIGGPLWYPPYYYYPPYYPPYYPAVVNVPPTYYVEQGSPAPQAPAAATTLAPGYWYYCNGPDGYYPYVKECPGGWQRVSPQPAN
jgi:hypothetical protein